MTSVLSWSCPNSFTLSAIYSMFFSKASIWCASQGIYPVTAMPASLYLDSQGKLLCALPSYIMQSAYICINTNPFFIKLFLKKKPPGSAQPWVSPNPFLRPFFKRLPLFNFNHSHHQGKRHETALFYRQKTH